MKHLVFVTSLTSNSTGSVTLKLMPATGFKVSQLTRRVSRTATLDGGSVFVDSGFSHSDRTLVLKFTAAEADKDNLKALIASDSFVRLAMNEGLFIGVIESGTFDQKICSLKFLVSEKIT